MKRYTGPRTCMGSCEHDNDSSGLCPMELAYQCFAWWRVFQKINTLHMNLMLSIGMFGWHRTLNSPNNVWCRLIMILDLGWLKSARFLTAVKMSMLVSWVAMRRNILPPSSVLMMETVCFSETSVYTYKSTWCPPQETNIDMSAIYSAV
jgi:hypothetical protein